MSLLALFLRPLVAVMVLGVTATALGCAHTVQIETNPIGARVSVDGEFVGVSPVKVKKVVFVGDQLRVAVEAEGYEPQTTIVPASEWFPWPGLLACTPALGLPIATPFAVGLLPFCGVGLFVGPAIAVGWAVVTSPTLLTLGLVRKYPDRVFVHLRRRQDEDGVVLPGEIFYVPDDATPNPLPLPAVDDSGAAPGDDDRGPTGGPPPSATQRGSGSPSTGGGNPIP